LGSLYAKEQGEVYADVVLATDGVNSLIAEKEKLRNPFKLQDLALGVKEVIKLPSNEIEKRFHLSGNEGAAYTFVGEVTQGLQGGGFLYTNRESISVGVVVQLSSLKKAGIKPFEFLDLFKENPNIAPLVAGGSLREYSAHLIPEGAYHMVPRLNAHGIILAGDAAALALNNGFIVRGMDFAIASGVAAGDTIIRAKERGDFSANSLFYYKQLLEKSFVLRDLKKFRRLPKFFQTERIYKEYPAWICGVFQNLFSIDGKPRKKALQILLKEKPKKLTYLRGVVDLFKGMRDL
jgi:electron transfer flavoprotein-quinone oxidoreductase